MLDPVEDVNASATFLEFAEGIASGPYDDPDDDWQVTHEQVPGLFEPESSARVNDETGERTRTEERFYTVLGLASEVSVGMRVDVHYRPVDRTFRRRVASAAPRSDGIQGYLRLGLADHGD